MDAKKTDESEDSEPPPTSENAIIYKQDRIRVIESAEGAPIISFSHLSWETALEIVCNPVQQPYCDLLENTILFTFPIFLKQKKPHKCDCKRKFCCCNTPASSQVQLLQLVMEMMLPDPSLSQNDLQFIRPDTRCWRDSCFDFLHRWLVLRYPEDSNKEVLEVLMLLYQRVCEEEGVLGKV